MDSLDRGPAPVVGHSLGGYTSLKFARRRPESLRGLILAGPGASTHGLFRAGEADFARAQLCARVELIPRARHLADFDDPDPFTDAARRFARQLPAVC
ncbi:alpha/beta hydrolase [Streptomyces sp. NPDC006172]|uniref:alpha/beta fold hydrolase n=1 Tax=Streptomyces sp. NPDC006172 TaxID=3154470 RepID=UPI0033E17CD3